MRVGRFFSGGAVRKCLSMACAPSRNSRTVPKPYCSARGSTPTALHTEKRPPTQSQKPKTLASSMPKALVFGSAVEQATTCLATAASLPSSSTIHFFTVLALSIVSAVVKVLETTITRVVSALRPSRARFTSMGSTFARNRRRRPLAAAAASGCVRRASKTNSTPRYEPPMPMQTTSVSGFPVKPVKAPERTCSENAFMASRTECTSGTTFLPSTLMVSSLAALSATCRTARPSVSLIFSPAKSFFFFPSTSVAFARSKSWPMVSAVTFWRQ
mmetsp:Transcript_68541/g.201182  ORF Transcript_68541/g.201182 Transcript_68541/m.201182 type:complete len:272 (+) Transcript_68541:236-1051(+)